MLPNGILVIEAERQVAFNQQTQMIRLRGLVRPSDVNANNQVLSTAVTDLELEVVGKGIINDYTYRQNPLVRFLERLVVFCSDAGWSADAEAYSMGGATGCAYASSLRCGCTADSAAHRVRIKDVATIEGIRENQLIGYGIVVGLSGTGDSQQTVFPVQTLISTLQRMGVNVPTTGSASTLRVQNMAAVFIAATLPPFSEPGTKLDVTVSSAGDARSLNGGLLLMTPLYGPDGRIYAQAQGPIVLGGYAAAANGNAKVVNHPTTGRIPGGAMVERGVPLDLSRLPSLSILLNDADFRTAERMADAINTATDSVHLHMPQTAGASICILRRARICRLCWRV